MEQILSVAAWLLIASSVHAQLSVLSVEDPAAKWRTAQLATVGQQLDDEALSKELRLELAAQKRWLEAWQPGALSDKPLWKSNLDNRRKLEEPVLDPDRNASGLRKRLLGDNAKPAVSDTQSLRDALVEKPQDIGLRQLHLHWIDQRQYRKQYADAIAQSAQQLDVMLQSIKPTTGEIELARIFCLYRKARALVYRALPDVVAVNPIEDPERHAAMLVGTYATLKSLVGDQSRPEFILLDIRMLRRDGWRGRALALLEKYGSTVERQWLLKKRRDLLEELGWESPYREAAELYAREFPEEVAKERKAG